MVRNKGENPVYVSPSSFILVTPNHAYPVDYRTYHTPNPFFGRRLRPLRQVRGTLVFATSESPLRLIYNDKLGNLKICEIQTTQIKKASLTP